MATQLTMFSGVDSAGIRGLWLTDGTAAGTREVTGIAGASAFGLFAGPGFTVDPDFTSFNGEVLLTGLDAAGNHGLWVTDGTAAGTHELAINGAYPGMPGLSPQFLTV